MAEAEDIDTLRKKPVRRGTAKKAESKQETLQPRTTRSRKPASTLVEDGSAMGQSLAGQAELPIQVKPARRGGRQKKDEFVPPEADESAIKQQPKTTRATTSRARKNEVMIDEAPELPVATGSKATRRTRATTTKAPPLSPKKITQVTKPATRMTKAAGMKLKAARNAQTTRTTRKRAASDENADMLMMQSTPACVDEDILANSSTSNKHASPFKEIVKKDDALRSEASMSSRPTTPSESPASNFDRMTDEHEYAQRDATLSESEIEDEEGIRQNEESEDELCGPKTPMKRSSPGAEARYLSSVHRTILRDITERSMASSPAQSMPLSCQGLAMSQKQHTEDQAAVPRAEAVPTTVVRGTNGPCDLRDIHSPTPATSYPKSSVSENEEISLDTEKCNSPDAIDMDAHYEESEVILDNAFVDNADELEEDVSPDETMTVSQTNAEELAFDLSVVEAVYESFESEDTVIFTEADNVPDTQDSERDDLVTSPHASLVPETLVWENIKQDVTIPINFEKHFSNIGSPSNRTVLEVAPLEDTNVTSNAAFFSLPDLEEHQPATGARLTEASTTDQLTLIAREARETADRDVTVNLNDFIDVSALTEQTEALEEPDPPLAHDLETSEIVADFKRVQPQHQPENTDRRPNMQHTILDSVLVDELHVPHYALTTFAFDARRKSLPAFNNQTPIKLGVRPHTSDGASMPRMAHPITDAWWSRWSRSRAISGASTPWTTPSRQQVEASQANALADTELQKQEDHVLHNETPRERYPRLGSKQTYTEHAKTVTVPTRFRTPQTTPTTRPLSAQKPTAMVVTPRASSLRPRPVARNRTGACELNTPGSSGELPSVALTPQVTPSERFSRRAPRNNYEEYANTVAAPARFKTPNQASNKRPDTVQKHGSLRKVSFNVTMTPGYSPMTPHPAAPLQGVLALVEIFTLEGASASAPFVALLHRLGAKTTRAWNDHVTHVIFKDGSPTTLQRVRIHNKEAEESGNAPLIHCVNSRWVSDCEMEGRRVDERDEEYTVDVDEVPRGGRRRRKSMEPSALMNLGGNIVRDRTSSWGRCSASRSPIKLNSLIVEAEAEDVESTSKAVPEEEKENSTDEPSSPATPAYLAAPNELIQKTAPVNRMRKLGLKAQDRARNRRLTYFPSRV